MDSKFARIIIILIIIINIGLVYWNVKTRKEIKSLRNECYLLTVWGGNITASVGNSLMAIQRMRNDIEELKKKPKAFY